MRDTANAGAALRAAAAGGGVVSEAAAMRVAAWLQRTGAQHGIPRPTVRDVCGMLLRAEDVARGAVVAQAEAEWALRELGRVGARECRVGLPAQHVTSTACPRLDRVLRGGFLHGTITELAGPAGVGKSQLLLQTCLQSLLPPPDPRAQADTGRAVYIACEPFPCERAHQLARVWAARHPAVWGSAADIMDQLLISGRGRQESHVAHLEQCVANLRRLLEGGQRVTCVALDSIAVACGDYAGEAAVRAPLLARIANELKHFAAAHNFPVLVANHVVSVVDPAADSTHRVFDVRPALGLAWASLPNTHLLLTRNGAAGPRRLHIAASAHLPRDSTEFEVRHGGVFGVPGPGQR